MIYDKIRQKTFWVVTVLPRKNTVSICPIKIFKFVHKYPLTFGKKRLK
ncbi:Uncharacterised protein [uncultured Ruminococcus sp.]|nr:Uncharacterised protein [uncultured Clostridium sp.]SCI23031.1 Uncharacterised protein [uncultured Ruminococcus sp.]